MFKRRWNNRKRVYMDYASSTPLDKNVYKTMRKYGVRNFANPSAIHKEAMAARGAIDKARAAVADVLGAHSDEIVFTSGGTEGDNLAILGVINAYAREIADWTQTDAEKEIDVDQSKISVDQYSRRRREKPHVIITNIEHSAVRETCRELASQGRIELTEVPVEKNGIVNPRKIKKALKEETVLVSVAYANNEIGTIQPIADIVKVIRRYRKSQITRNKYQTNSKSQIPSPKLSNLAAAYPLLHTDAAQAVNYLPIGVAKLGVDLFSFNGSKIYGPKGIGVLYVKKGVSIYPIMYGGNQENGLRSGTEDTVSIIGLAKALEIVEAKKEKETKRLSALRDYFMEEIQNRFSKIIINGDRSIRLPNNINISIPGLESELLVLELDALGVAASARSACKSTEPGESYVIHALRPNNTKEESSLRISMGRKTSKGDIIYVIRALEDILKKYKITIN